LSVYYVILSRLKPCGKPVRAPPFLARTVSPIPGFRTMDNPFDAYRLFTIQMINTITTKVPISPYPNMVVSYFY
jgi:hypothetical protein